jgi:hypothetical protein
MLWSVLAIRVLLLLQAVLGAGHKRSMASPSQGGSTAPAFYIREAQILNMSQALLRFSSQGLLIGHLPYLQRKG